MRKLCLIILLAAGLLLLPFIAYGSYGTESADKTPPPVSQTLVREGDFAVRLADRLGVVKTSDEGKAEEALAEAGIKPKSGWISDFPVTPDVLAEIRTSVQAAADNGRIKKDKGEADAEVMALSKEMGIEMVAASKGAKGYITGEQYGEETPPADEGEYEYQSPTVVNNYYYEEGPPVVTYYPPPPDYAYLYAWDPFPFWYGTYFFPGYYVLRDFTTTVVVNSGGAVNINADKVIVKGGPGVSGATTTKVVSNRVFNRTTNSTVTLDPVSRRVSTASAGARPFSTFNRNSARNIVAGSKGRMAGSFTNRGSIAPSGTGIAPSRGTAGGVRSRGGTVSSSRNTAPATVTGRGFDPAPSLRGRAAGSGGIAPVAPSRTFSSKSFDPAPSLRGHVAGSGGVAPGAAGRSFGPAPSLRGHAAGSGGVAPVTIAPNRGFVAPAPRSFSQPAPAFSSSRGFVGSGRAFGAPPAGGRSIGGGSPGGRSLGGGFGGFGGRGGGRR